MQQGEVGSGDLNNSSYNWSLLSWGLFFFQLNSWPSVAAQLSGCRLLSAMQCPLPGLMGWLRDEQWETRGLCHKNKDVSVCQAVAHDCSCCGDGTSYKLVRTTPALAWAGAQDSGCATARSGMSPQAGSMPGLHSRSGTVWIKCSPSLLVLLLSCFFLLRIQKMPPMYIPQYRPLPEEKNEVCNSVHKILEIITRLGGGILVL